MMSGIMSLKKIWMFSVIFLLSACGGGTQSTGVPASGVPTSINWTEPQENADASELTNLVSYRFYYGSSPTTLSAITALDLPASSPNPVAGGTVTYVFPESDITIMTPLVAKNTTHYFAMTAINSLGIESSLSDIFQYIP
jgi:hypothetical protein